MSHGNCRDMFNAVQNNDFELIDFYIRMGTDVNYQHPEFMTNSLFESIRNNNAKMVAFLLKHGALPDAIEVDTGKSAIAIAQEFNNAEIVESINQLLQGNKP